MILTDEEVVKLWCAFKEMTIELARVGSLPAGLSTGALVKDAKRCTSWYTKRWGLDEAVVERLNEAQGLHQQGEGRSG